LQNAPSVFVRHQHVEQYEIGKAVSQALRHFLSVVRYPQDAIQVLQVALVELRRLGLVVDDEDRPWPRRRQRESQRRFLALTLQPQPAPIHVQQSLADHKPIRLGDVAPGSLLGVESVQYPLHVAPSRLHRQRQRLRLGHRGCLGDQVQDDLSQHGRVGVGRGEAGGGRDGDLEPLLLSIEVEEGEHVAQGVTEVHAPAMGGARQRRGLLARVRARVDGRLIDGRLTAGEALIALPQDIGDGGEGLAVVAVVGGSSQAQFLARLIGAEALDVTLAHDAIAHPLGVAERDAVRGAQHLDGLGQHLAQGEPPGFLGRGVRDEAARQRMRLEMGGVVEAGQRILNVA